MSDFQHYGMRNFQSKNAAMFRANTKPVGEAVQRTAGKSGVYQAAVNKLANIQTELEYGYFLLRTNDWFNPANVRKSDQTIYEIYQSKIKKLKLEKKEVIDEILKQIKEDDRYKDFSEDCLKRIEEYIDCYSTWDGFYFNDEVINAIISKMK